MAQPSDERMRWRDNPNAVELGFDHYLTLIERRLKGEDVSLVQGLRSFYREALSINLRETQARGLMHWESSVFRDYVNSIFESEFLPNIEYWEARGLEQFLEWKSNFYRARDIEAVDIDIEERDLREEIRRRGSTEPPERREMKENRVIRDSALSRFLKSLYSHQCQICKFTFRFTAGRRYAETHHIKPLGWKHNGIDKETNKIVLCSNHHAMMDFGAIAIHPERMTLISVDTTYPEHQKPIELMKHPVDRDFLEYHLENIFGKM